MLLPGITMTNIYIAIFSLNIIYPYTITFNSHPWEAILVQFYGWGNSCGCRNNGFPGTSKHARHFTYIISFNPFNCHTIRYYSAHFMRKIQSQIICQMLFICTIMEWMCKPGSDDLTSCLFAVTLRKWSKTTAFTPGLYCVYGIG